MLAFHNGRFVPYAELKLPPHDAGFVFGATVTDFCRTYAHKLFRWPDHLARLRRDAEACFIPLPYTDAELTAAAEQLVNENTKGLPPGDDLALITFATPGPLGYMVGDATNGPPTLAMHTFPLPKERYRRFFTEGVTLAFAGLEVGGHEPVLESAKHRSRMKWWLAGRRQAEPAGIPLILSSVGSPDTPIGGVLAVRGATVFAPPPFAVLDSVSVRVVRELCGRVGLSFAHRTSWYADECYGDTEWLLGGTAFGVAGVREYTGTVESKCFPWPGPVFTKLAAAWSELVGVDIVTQFTG